MGPMVILALVLLVLVGAALLPLRHPATKVRVLYLSKNRQSGSYIRFRPNPAIQVGSYHFCTARKRTCRYRKPKGTTVSRHNYKTGII